MGRSGSSRAGSAPAGGRSSSTMIVIRMAITPSLKASMRPLLMGSLSVLKNSVSFGWGYAGQAENRVRSALAKCALPWHPDFPPHPDVQQDGGPHAEGL